MLEAYLPFFASRYGEEVEFLVVVNGSTDNTDGVVAGYTTRFPSLRMLVEPAAIGKGGAVMLGLREARGECVGFVDADGSTPPDAFQKLVDHLGDAGGIIASRWAKGAEVSPQQPLDRRVASRIFNFLTRVLFGLRLTDTQCGAKVLTREACQAILPHLGITQWAFDVDLLFQLRRAGFSIKEIPTVWHDVAGSKIQVGKASTEMVLALTRLRLLYSPFRWVVVGLYDRYIGPWIHPAGMTRDHLLTHSLMLLAGAQIGGVLNILFQSVMVRLLTQADYGTMMATLALLMMISLPLGALSSTFTHFTANLVARREVHRIRALMKAAARDLLIPATGIVVLATVIWKQKFMVMQHLDSPWPLYLAAATVVVLLLGAVPGGVLAGLQAFEWVALVGNSWPAFRLGLGMVLVLCGLGAVGALIGHLISILASGVFAFVVCWSLLGKSTGGPGGPVRAERPEGLYSYLFWFMAASIPYAVLLSADVVMVKAHFSAEQTGVFAAAAMVARLVIFLPGPIAMAMFPKVSSTGDSSLASRRTLYKAMVLTGLAAAGVGGICLVMPEFMLRVLAKQALPGQVEVLRGMVLALTPLTLLQLVMNYELAQRRFGIMIPLYLCAGAYVAGVWQWHETPMQIVTSLGLSGTAALALCLLFLRREPGTAGRVKGMA